MAELTPVSWAALIKRLRELGFDGPFRGSKHPYMVKDDTLRPGYTEPVCFNVK